MREMNERDKGLKKKRDITIADVVAKNGGVNII